jgi:hypothetical protein
MTLFIVFIFVYLPVYICVYRHPFYISMSSKAMLSVIPQVMCSKFPVVLQMDCTFKCNDNEFPNLIIGITDAQPHLQRLPTPVPQASLGI